MSFSGKPPGWWVAWIVDSSWKLPWRPDECRPLIRSGRRRTSWATWIALRLSNPRRGCLSGRKPSWNHSGIGYTIERSLVYLFLFVNVFPIPINFYTPYKKVEIKFVQVCEGTLNCFQKQLPTSQSFWFWKFELPFYQNRSFLFCLFGVKPAYHINWISK